jgi:hypothetical protein
MLWVQLLPLPCRYALPSAHNGFEQLHQNAFSNGKTLRYHSDLKGSLATESQNTVLPLQPGTLC